MYITGEKHSITLEQNNISINLSIVRNEYCDARIENKTLFFNDIFVRKFNLAFGSSTADVCTFSTK